jgi:hypothetical protein
MKNLQTVPNSFKLFVIHLLLIVIVFSSLSPAKGDQQENKAPLGWMFGGNPSNFRTSLDETISQHGKGSAAMESSIENPPEFCTLMQTMTINNFSGKRIKMTGFIKTQGENVNGSMWMRVDDLGNKIFADFDNMMDRPVSGNTDWTKCEIVFDVPEKCVVAFGFIMTGSGKIWVDNVSFEIVDNTVSKTANSLDQPFSDEFLNQMKDLPAVLPEKLPLNLDFEESPSK